MYWLIYCHFTITYFIFNLHWGCFVKHTEHYFIYINSRGLWREAPIFFFFSWWRLKKTSVKHVTFKERKAENRTFFKASYIKRATFNQAWGHARDFQCACSDGQLIDKHTIKVKGAITKKCTGDLSGLVQLNHFQFFLEPLGLILTATRCPIHGLKFSKGYFFLSNTKYMTYKGPNPKMSRFLDLLVPCAKLTDYLSFGWRWWPNLVKTR